MLVRKARFDESSGAPWWRILVKIPELHLETPDLFTAEYAQDLVDMIVDDIELCPHCGKQI